MCRPGSYRRNVSIASANTTPVGLKLKSNNSLRTTILKGRCQLLYHILDSASMLIYHPRDTLYAARLLRKYKPGLMRYVNMRQVTSLLTTRPSPILVSKQLARAVLQARIAVQHQTSPSGGLIIIFVSISAWHQVLPAFESMEPN